MEDAAAAASAAQPAPSAAPDAMDDAKSVGSNADGGMRGAASSGSGSESDGDAASGGARSDGSDTPRLGPPRRRGKKKIVRRRRKGAAAETEPKPKPAKKTTVKKYVQDAAEESDGEGGVASSDDEEGDEEEDEELAGFIVKDGAEDDEDSGVSDSGSDSNSDSDDSDDDDDEGNPRKKRRLIKHKEREVDDDDLLLVAEAAEDGKVQLDARTRAKLEARRARLGEEGGAEGGLFSPASAGGGAGSGAEGGAAAAAASGEAEDGPAAPNAFDRDYESDGLDDFIVDDGAGGGAYAAESRRAAKRKRGAIAGGFGATQEELDQFTELFGSGARTALLGGKSTSATSASSFAALFDDAPMLGAAVRGGLEGEGEEDDEEEDEDFLPPAEAEAKRRAKEEKKKATAIAAAQKLGAASAAALAPGAGPVSAASSLAAADARKAAVIAASLEPAELAKHYITARDREIRMRDEPERLQVGLRARRLRRARVAAAAAAAAEGSVTKAVCDAQSSSREGEVTWITDHLFTRPGAALSDPYADVLSSTATLPTTADQARDGILPDPAAVATTVNTVLTAVLEQGHEIPYIHWYRKDELAAGVKLRHLWSILDLDDVWCRLQARKVTLAQGIDRAVATGLLSADAEAPRLRDVLINAASERAVEDVAVCLDTLAAAAQARKAADEAILPSFALLDDSDAAPLSGAAAARQAGAKASAAAAASRSDLYRLAYSTDVHKIVPRIFLPAEAVAQNLRAGSLVHTPPDPGPLTDTRSHLLDLALEAVGAEFADDQSVLRAARHVAATELARDPYILGLLRQMYYKRVHVDVTPTEKGKSALDTAHPYFGLHVIKNKALEAFATWAARKPLPGGVSTDPFADAYKSLRDDQHPSVVWELGAEYLGPDYFGFDAGYASHVAATRVDPVGEEAGSRDPNADPSAPPPASKIVYARHEPRVGSLTQYVLLSKAESDGFITMRIDADERCAADMINLLCSCALSDVGVAALTGTGGADPKHVPLASELDKQRREAIITAVERMLVPEFRKEVKTHMQRLADDAVAAEYACALRRAVNMAPIEPPPQQLRKRKADEGEDGSAAARSGAEEVRKQPWQRARHRVMVVGIARAADNAADVALLLDGRGDLVEHITLPPSRDQAGVALGEFMFNQAPDLVVLNATAGMMRCRDMKRTVMEASIAYDFLVKQARNNYKRRKELRKQYGASVAHSSDESVRQSWAASSMKPSLEAAAIKWASGEWRYLKPRTFALTTEQRRGMTVTVPNEHSTTLPVSFVPDEVARVYAGSARSKADFPEYSNMVRYAVSLGRYAQDPLAETAYMWASRGDISATGAATAREAGVTSVSTDAVGARLHPLQSEVPSHLLHMAAERVMVEIVNGAGVDINGVVNRPHLSTQLQFIAGLGPRKALYLLQAMARVNNRFLFRSDMNRPDFLGQTVYNNAAGFLRVGPVHAMLGPKRTLRGGLAGDAGEGGEDSGVIKVGRRGRDVDAGRRDVDDAAYNPLDATRIHPKDYKFALEFLQDRDPAAATQPSRWDVDKADPMTYTRVVRENLAAVHDAVATFLSVPRSFDGVTAGKAAPYQYWAPNAFHKMVLAPGAAAPVLVDDEPEDGLELLDLQSYAEVLRARGEGEMYHTLEHIKQELRCPFRDSRRPWEPPSSYAMFRWLTGDTTATMRAGAVMTAEITDVGDKRANFRLDNGLRGGVSVHNAPGGEAGGFINLRDQFKVGQLVSVKILRVDHTSFYVDASAKPDDVSRISLPVMDEAADYVEALKIADEVNAALQAAAARASLEAGASGALLAAQQAGHTIHLRSIGHPAFKNITSREAVEYLAGKPLYEVVFRPSSKGTDHLTATWKLAEPNICAHIDITESGKQGLDPASIGRKLSLEGGRYVYSDLDEVLARHFDPCNMHHRSLRSARCYRDAPSSLVDQLLVEEMKDKPGRVPYFVSPDSTHIGFYRISYIITKRPHHEPVKVVPAGLVWRGKVSADWRRLIDDFKARVRSRDGVGLVDEVLPAASSPATQPAAPAATASGSSGRWGPATGAATVPAPAPAPAAASATRASRWAPAAPAAPAAASGGYGGYGGYGAPADAGNSAWGEVMSAAATSSAPSYGAPAGYGGYTAPSGGGYAAPSGGGYGVPAAGGYGAAAAAAAAGGYGQRAPTRWG